MHAESDFAKDKPLYTTSIVASMLEITADRLRTYDKEKLVLAHRVETGQVQRRLYTQYDVEWLKQLRKLVKDYKMSISSIKVLLQILHQNNGVKLPDNEIGETLNELAQNPNFEILVPKF